MKKPSFRNTSASQNDTFRKCERKWFLDKVVGRGPPTKAQLRGTGIHKSFLDGYLATGEIPDDEWVIYTQALKNGKNFPAIGLRDFKTEIRIDMPTLDGLPPWVGYVDCAVDEPLDDATKSLVRVIDLKTTSDLRWAKTREELKNDTQMMSYAYWAFEILGAERVIIQHVYLEVRQPPPKRVPPRIRPIEIEVFRDEVEEAWNTEMFRLTRMQTTLLLADTWEDVPPTGAPDHCNAYGGCQHRSVCGIDTAIGVPIANLLNPKKHNKESDKMPEDSPFMEKIKARKAAKLAAAAAAGETSETEKTVDFKPEEEEAQTLAPDAASRTDDDDESSEEEDEAVAKAAAQLKKAQEKAAKKKEAAEKKAAKKKAADDKKIAAAAKKAKPTVVPETGMTLYIDCFPLKGGNGVVQFEDWIKQTTDDLNEWALEKHQLIDFRLLSFAEEKAAFSKALKDRIEAEGLPAEMVISSGVPFQKDAMAALVPHARFVVKSMR